MTYWNPIRGIGSPIPIRQFKGVYKPEDEGFNLPDNLFTELINFSPDKYPAITTIPGYTVIGTFGASVLGLGAHRDQELHAVFSDGTWRKWSGTAWTQLASGLNTSARCSFVNFKGNLNQISLMMSNGVDPVKYYNGSTVQNLLNAPAGSKFIEQHDNRVYVATENTIRFSALAKSQDWTTVDDAGEILMESSNGETISAIKAGPKRLFVFKPNSMYDLLGTGPQSYTLIPVAADIGAINNNCVVNIGGFIYFLHTTGVYTYGSARPKKDFCDPIMQYIKRINLSSASKCSLGTDGFNLYVSLPLDNSTEPNIILQYNLEHGSWYTWSDYKAVEFSFIKGEMFIGNDDGSVRKVGGDSNNGNKIESIMITKPFTADSISRKSHWLKMWIVASLEVGSELNVYISGQASGEDWKFSSKLQATSNIQYKEILVPVNSVASAHAVRIKIVAKGNVTVHEITRLSRQLPMRN